MKHVKHFGQFLNENDKSQYSHIKDLDEPRPRFVPTAKPSGMMASEATKRFGLYVQDEACDIMVDKYGHERGVKNWEYTLEGSSGVMFAAASKIANEKLQMLRDLDMVDDYGKNYFSRSYLDIWKEWKEWMKSSGKKAA